jgi:hypothetical protein
MSSTHSSPRAAPTHTRAIALTALLGAALFAIPGASAWAQSAATPAPAATPGAADAADTKLETVEARISKLHGDLMITPNEEVKWGVVAKTMRNNASAMEKLAVNKSARNADSTTAVDDLLTYQEFAKAHLAGLTDLTSSFKTLYDSMPMAQKKNADKVFETFGRPRPAPQG